MLKPLRNILRKNKLRYTNRNMNTVIKYINEQLKTSTVEGRVSYLFVTSNFKGFTKRILLRV